MSHITYLNSAATRRQIQQILQDMEAAGMGRGQISANGHTVDADLLIRLASGGMIGFRENAGGRLDLVTGTGDPEAEAAGRAIVNQAVAANIRESLGRTRLQSLEEAALPDGGLQITFASVDTPDARVTVDLDASGGATVETFGVTGSRCKVMTQEIESAIGTVARVVRKSDRSDGKVALREHA